MVFGSSLLGVDIAIGVVALIYAIYWYTTSTYNFWSERNIPGPKPTIFFGNFKDFMFRKYSINDILAKIYKDFINEPIIGIYEARKPSLMLTDPDLIKDVLVKDFHTWADRGIDQVAPKYDPLSQHLFNAQPKTWRILRTHLTPTFTSGRLKEMFYLILDCAKHFEKHIGRNFQKSDTFETRELAAKYTTDVIGVCAFGLQMNSLSEEKSKFREIGRRIVKTTPMKIFRTKLREWLPKVYVCLAPLIDDKELTNFFLDTMRENIEFRKATKIRRNDFVDLLMDIQDDAKGAPINGIEITHELLTAQSVIFFVAGYETSSSTVSNAFYELAQRPDIQEKVRNEIKEELNKTEGKLTYESIKNMKYFHQIFCETLRKYPPVPFLTRKSMNDYQFDGSDVLIPEGTRVFIPIYAIHRNPNFFPDPEVFDPDRFSEENVKNRHKCHYLPFGEGPRKCVGERFGQYQTKVGIITVLRNYELEVCDKTQIPLDYSPTLILLTPKTGVYVRFRKILD